MQIAISTARYLILMILTGLATAYCLAYAFIPTYQVLFPNEGGGFDISYSSVAILIVALQFYIPLFFIALGDKVRYWAFGMLLLVILAIDYQIDPSRLMTFLFVVFLGGGLGWVLRFVTVRTLGKMPSLNPYKAYF